MPLLINLNANSAIIGEISIIPSGGMKFLKKPRYGSTIVPNKRPNAVSLVEGTQDMRMYITSNIV